MVVDPNRLLTVAEAAKLCPYSEPTIRSWIRYGRLQAVRLSGSIYIDQDVFTAFLLQHTK